MADIELKSFPFDSVDVLNEESGQMEPDREYLAEVFRNYFEKFLSTGVYFGNYKNYGEKSMKVETDIGLNIKVLKGAGNIKGADFENEEDRLIVLERPSSGERVDRIVVQFNALLDTRKTKLIVKQGNGTTPAELTRTDNIYEICIAEVTVKSTSNLTDDDIVDTRLDNDLCGVVNSLISIDGEELYQRFQEYLQSAEEDLMLKPDVLYNNDSGDTTINVDSSQSISNYVRLKIFLQDTRNNVLGSTEIYLNFSDTIYSSDNYFSTILTSGLGKVILGGITIDKENNIIQLMYSAAWQFGPNSISMINTDLKIIRVEGYKQ